MDDKNSAHILLKNRYKLEKIIGSGGIAVIYLAQDTLLERIIDCHILRKKYSDDQLVQNRFKFEAKSAANLSHPNIVAVYDFGYDAGRLFIIMEYVNGSDLKTLMRKKGIFSQKESVRLITQACEGLDYAHNNGIIHCDVKPHNFIITKDDKLKITDFGIAQALTNINSREKHDIVWGSPLYFSPEQAAGKAPSKSSDIYSLGVILYEMITGKPPFVSDDANELIMLHRSKKPIPPIEINKNVLPELNNITLKILSKDPSSRYRTISQLKNALSSLNFHNNLEQQTIISKKPEIIERAKSDTQRINLIKNKKVIPNQGIDWATIGLTLLALIALSGLIPFWIYVWLSLYPPGS